MALKGDRLTGSDLSTDISHFMNVTGEAGLIVTNKTAGSGASMDDDNQVVEIPTGGVSGAKPVGLLLCDVVNIDLTRQHLNQYKDEVQVSGKVTLLRHGQVTTNSIANGQSPTAGTDAYFDTAGKLTTVSTNCIKVGRFMSAKDADGYAKVEINIV